MLGDQRADLALALTDPQRLANLHADEVPHLLGALEQIRASLWARMLGSSGPAAREPVIDASDEILTVPRVADELKFTRSYVYEAIRRGDLAAVRKGKYVRVRRSALRAWLDGHAPARLDGARVASDSSRHVLAHPRPSSLPPRTARAARKARTAPAASPLPLRTP